MARLLVVSRSMALALRLADAHQVAEEEMDVLPDLAPGPGIDVIVLDVGEPSIAIQTLDRLRSTGHTTPLLVVSGYQPAWAGLVAVDIPGVLVVPLPITRGALLEGIDRLSRQAADDRAAAAHEAASHAAGETRPMRLPIAPPPVERLPIAAPPPPPPASEPVLLDPVPSEPVDLDPEPVEAVRLDPVLPDPVPLDPDTDPVVRLHVVPSGSDLQPDAHLGTDPAPDSDSDSDSDSDGATPDLFRPFVDPVLPQPGWHEPGFEWWNQELPDPGAPAVGPAVEPVPVPVVVELPAVELPAEHSVRQLRRGWPPPDDEDSGPVLLPMDPEPIDDDGYPADLDGPAADEIFPSPLGPAMSPALRSAIESAIQANRRNTAGAVPTTGPAPRPPVLPPAQPAQPVQPDAPAEAATPEERPDPFPLPAPITSVGVTTGPVGAPPTDDLLAQRRALLGRPADTGGVSAFRRRLGGRKYQTSLGPGGTSPELIALGLHGDHGAHPGDHPLGGDDADPSQWTQAPGPPPPAPADDPPDDARHDTLDERGRQPLRPPSSPAERQIAQQLVLQLIERCDDLYGVADTAQVLADDVLARTGSDAAAILVPDGAVWRVSAGVGLRPLERRLVLDEAHWLIEQVLGGERPVLVTDTDQVRQQLAGAPLAAWRHLLAVPMPAVRTVVLLARGPETAPFGDEQVRALSGSLDEATALLQSAVQIRHLARLLAPLCDGVSP